MGEVKHGSERKLAAAATPRHAHQLTLFSTQVQRIDYSLALLERQLGQPRAAFLAQPELHWSVKGLRDEHAPALAHVLTSNKALQELGLARNQLTGARTLTLTLASR